ncbi:MAG: response regulator [Alphaproteobacteria bacterium]|nr:response regulator [Alphaproteobacteria bacterium]
MTTILLAEDDANMAALMQRYLERDSFDVLVEPDGVRALRAAREQAPDLLLLDIMLPGLDGWEICRELRRTSAIPIIILSARLDEADRIAGLRLGADDYVIKPFSPAEVVERVKAVLRRTQPAAGATAEEELLTRGAIVLSPGRFSVTVGGAPVALTLSEFKILETLMRAPGRVYTREQLLAAMHLDGGDVIDRTVDVHIVNLRRKIERRPGAPSYIQTVRGVGYRFAEPFQ